MFDENIIIQYWKFESFYFQYRNKEFKLLVLVDKDKPRKIPLHEGQALKKIKDIERYDENKHLWVSSDEVSKHLFQSNSNKIKNYIEDLLKYTNPN